MTSEIQQNANVEDQPGDLPFDFLMYLERRLELSREAALALLGECLIAYKPVGPRSIRAMMVHSGADPRGVSSAA